MRNQPTHLPTKLPFKQSLRNKIDTIIEEVNRIIIGEGFERMPLGKYKVKIYAM